MLPCVMNNDRRAIIHVDMDAFYAAVEQLDNPKLSGLPLIVAGLGPRSVVYTASYPARVFGVRSAMPSVVARRLCPEGIFIPPRIQRYREVSQQILSIMKEISPEIETLSLDEAYLDVTRSQRLLGDISSIGRRVKNEIYRRTGLIASVGMAHNKFLAKLASELGKPDGFVHISPEEVQIRLDPLPVGRLWSVGKVAESALHAKGIFNVHDLRSRPISDLALLLGERQAQFLFRLAHGEDPRDVNANGEGRSISVERTFEQDVKSLTKAEFHLLQLCETLGERVRQEGLRGRKLSVKLRRPPLVTMTRQCTLSSPSNATDIFHEHAKYLLIHWWREHAGSGLRLLGVALSQFESTIQPDLFSQGTLEQRDLMMDAVNRRFGKGALRRGRGVEKTREL